MISGGSRKAVAVLGDFWRDDTGQDLIEYTLLLAVVALCAIGLFAGIRSNNSAIWSSINTGLVSAQSAAS